MDETPQDAVVDTAEAKGSEEKAQSEGSVKKMRQIVIETDGNDIRLVSAEVSGKIELVAILEGIIGFIRSGGK